MIFAPSSQVIVQGITESIGRTYAPILRHYGTQVIAGVSPGWGNQFIAEIPVFDLVEQVVNRCGRIDISLICTHPYDVLDAAIEAMQVGIRQLILITQGVPPIDMVDLILQAEATDTLLVGPNGPGVILPGKMLLGTHPPMFYTPGRVGLLTRNGPLTYDVARTLTKAGIGQSIGVSIGSDSIVGSTFQQWLQILEEDEETDAIVLVGEIGGESEELAATYISESIDKPVIAYVAGQTAPRDRRLGHAGTLIEAKTGDFGAELGTAESKISAFKKAGVPVADRPSQIPDLLCRVMSPKRNRARTVVAKSTAVI